MKRIATDNPFSEENIRTLSTLVGMMIPASEKYNVPSADDESILAEIIVAVGDQSAMIVLGLEVLNEKAWDEGRGSFTDLTDDLRMTIVEQLKETSVDFLQNVVTLTSQCYYRDPRVMESLGMEPRPPFPEGFEVEQSDWLMLDPVRDRGRIWRQPRGK